MAQNKIQSRDEKMVEQTNSPIKLNTSIKIMMPRHYVTEDDKKFKCTCCGESWNTQKSHFCKTASPLYQSNNGYLTICNDCRDKYYYQLVDLYNGNESHAIKHICQQFDIIFNIDALTASRQISVDRSRISHYLAKKNLGQTARIGATYIDGMKYDYENQLSSVISSKEQTKNDNVAVTATAIDRWGVGFTEADYKNLDDHYKMLKKNNPNADNNQEIFIKALCNINMLMIRALNKGDSKEYTSLVEQYSKTFKQAGLRTIEERDSSNDEVFGVTLATISQYTPEEFYKDKELYSNWDEIGEYFDRHVCRPMQNIMTGSDIRDKEFFVPEDEDDE